MFSISLLCLAVFLAATSIPLAQAQSNIFSLFCSAVRAGVAKGIQSQSCPIPGLGQANNLQQQQNQPLQQQQQQSPLQQSPLQSFSTAATTPTGSNVPPCPTGFTFTAPASCTPIAATIITPAIAIATTPSQVVSRGSPVTLDGSSSVGSVSQVPGTTSQNTATVIGYTWTQTAGPSVGTIPNTVRAVFTAPQNSTTLSFSLTVLDSSNQQSAPSAPVSILVR